MNYVLYQVVNTREHGWMGLEERGGILATESIDLDLYSVAYEGEVEGVSNSRLSPTLCVGE